MSWSASRKRPAWPYGALALLAGLLALTGPGAAQQAQYNSTTGLDLLGNWRETEMYLRDSGALPADCEFTAPIAVAYNWAYNAYVVAFSVRIPGNSQYMAAVAVEQDDALDVVASAGPLDAPAQWHAGPWHVAAGLPDGRLIVWLTAPREYPRQIVLATDYTPGSALQLQVAPPNPVATVWKDWAVTYVYEYGTNWPALTVAYADGNGAPQGYIEAIGLATRLSSVAYAYAGEGSTAAPYLFFSYDLLSSDGSPSGTLISQYAWHTSQGWAIRDCGIPRGPLNYLALDPRGEMTVLLVAGDEATGDNAALQLAGGIAANRESLSTQLSPAISLPVYPADGCLAAVVSTRSSYPLLALSDGADVYLGWQSSHSASGFGYYFALLHSGQTYLSGGSYYPRSPVVGLAATAHWQSGDPRLYWVQQGGSGGPQPVLVRLSYEPPR